LRYAGEFAARSPIWRPAQKDCVGGLAIFNCTAFRLKIVTSHLIQFAKTDPLQWNDADFATRRVLPWTETPDELTSCAQYILLYIPVKFHNPLILRIVQPQKISLCEIVNAARAV
jgi:hypothetical protein